MIEYLSLTGELIQRTSNTARVQEIVQLSLAPVFLLAAIGAMLNVMNLRLTWLINRINLIERRAAKNGGGRRRTACRLGHSRDRKVMHGVTAAT